MFMSQVLDMADDREEEPEDYLRPSEAAALLHVSAQTVRRWATKGRLRSVPTAGGHRRFPRYVVEELRAHLQQQATPDARRERPTPAPSHAISRPPRDFTIRAEQPADRRAIADVITAAFGSPAARFVDAIRASRNFVPDLSLIADFQGRIVGHVMISRALVRDRDTRHQVAILLPLAVLPDFQGRGIASALVREVTARADAHGEPIVAVEGSPTFYERLGFEPSMHYGIQIPLPTWAPPEAALALRLRRYDPSIRGRLVYPPAFDGVDGGAVNP